ncbi:MAG: hypothetical protein DMG13_03190 [Acidobacteria bacterium]|nr:MAG: hypothetical protein DMG13_03190 [Acidobacteriota bacterium]
MEIEATKKLTTVNGGEAMLKPGGNVDSWCGKCKLVLAHTIEAMVGDKPARVHCNTCNAQHTYKPHQPGGSPRKVREREAGGVARPQPKVRVSHYQGLLKGKDMALAKRYSPKGNYAPGDVLDHPTFGVGVATVLKDSSKIEVLFEAGPKLLVHGR